MAVLKWLKEKTNADKIWEALYSKEIVARLRRDKNLGDLQDRNEAKQNLDLIGEVEDHWHDSRYVPRLETLENELKILKGTTDAKFAENDAKNTEQDNRLAQLESRCTALEKKVATLQSQMAAIGTTIKNAVFDAQGRLKFPNGNRLWVEQ